MRAALLLRVSDPRQAGADAYSLDAQRQAGRILCERRGWVVVREYSGAGESAFTRDMSKRETVRSLLADATSDVFDALVVHDLTRYARDEELGHAVLNSLQALGIKLINATNEVDYDTPEGRLMFSIELGFSAASSRKASFHIRKSKQQKFEMGLHLGDVPFGYINGASNKSPLVPVPHEASAISEAFRDYVAGTGYIELVRRFNAQNLRPHSKQGNAMFTTSAMQSLIENDFYAGFIRHKGERRRGAHEPIITEEVWIAAQARVRRQPSRARQPRLLANLVVCDPCDGPIWQCKSGAKLNYFYYREASQRRQVACINAGKMWRADDAEAVVDQVIRAIAMDSEWLATVDRSARRIEPVDDGQRKRLETRRRKINDAYFGDEIEKPEWQRRLADVDQQIDVLPAATPETVVFARKKLESIGQVWVGMTVNEKREACRILFEGIKMNTRQKQMRFRPWPEFQKLFEMRAEFCRLGTPGRTRTCAQGLGNLCSIL